MPGGTPRWIRCYDNGGVPQGTFDRFTVLYTKRRTDGVFTHVGMSAHPFHPQGFGQHGESQQPLDVNKHGFAPALGRRCHLGKRIPFADLPPDCQRLVISDYKEIWNLKPATV